MRRVKEILKSLWRTAKRTDILDLPAAARRSAKAFRRGLWRRATMAAMKRTRRRWRLPSVPAGAVWRRLVPLCRTRGVTPSHAAAARPSGRWRGVCQRPPALPFGQRLRPLASRSARFGADPPGAAFADALHGAEPCDVGAQRGRGADVRGDLCLDECGFFFQRADGAREALGDDGIGGGLGAVALGLEQGGKVGQAAQQGAQVFLFGTGGLPVAQGAGGAKGGDELRVDAVGLVAQPEAARVVLDAAPSWRGGRGGPRRAARRRPARCRCRWPRAR